jgi:zinc transporter ZupT
MLRSSTYATLYIMDTIFFPTLIASFGIMLASLVGVVFTWKTLGAWLTPRLRYLIALAAGVFTVIIYGLLEEVLHEGFSLLVVGSFVLGVVLLEIVTRLLPKNSHHHHGPCAEHTHEKIDARRMLVMDAVHNVHDGLTLVPAFLVSPVLGFGVSLGVFFHELVQEISIFFILKEAGYSTKKALVWSFAISTTLLLGVLLSATLASVTNLALPLVAFSAGGFIYILLRDLLPSIYSHACTEKKYKQYAFAFVVGFLIMLAVTILLPHERDPAEDFFLPEGFGIA